MILAEHDSNECHYFYANMRQNPNWRVPILSRGLYHAIGHCGLTPRCDGYIDKLSGMAGISKRIAIETDMVQLSCGVAPNDGDENDRVTKSDYNVRRFDIDKIKLGAVLGRKLAPGNFPSGDWP